MMQRLRNRASDESGFTLIELLVVILIIGILAAIAIPAFLNQTQKANDSSAKSLVRNAATIATSIATENSGSYKELSSTAAKEKFNKESIPTAEGKGDAWLSTAEGMEGKTKGCTGAGECNGYLLVATAPTTKDTYTIESVEGTITRTCSPAGKGGCPTGGDW